MSIDLTDAETLEMSNGEGGFELLPPNRYILQVDEAKLKESNKGTFLTLRFEVSQGSFKRRKIWSDFLVSSSDEDDKTKSWIGTSKAKLKLILMIANKKIEKPQPEDFLGISLEGTVTQDVSNPDFPKNRIKYFAKLKDNPVEALTEALTKQDKEDVELEDSPF